MEAIVMFVVWLAILVLLALSAAIVWKNRLRLKKWLDKPSAQSYPQWRTLLERQVEDAQAQLDELDEIARGN